MQDETELTDGPVCPSCERALAAGTQICAPCGIYLPSGRPLITANKLEDENTYYETKATMVRWISRVMPLGILALTSQAGGNRKPWALWIIMGITIFVSGVFFICERQGSKKMWAMKNLMLWAGDKEPTPAQIFNQYEGTSWGNTHRFMKKYNQLMEKVREAQEEKEAIEEAKSRAAGETPEQRFKRMFKEEREKRKKQQEEEDDSDDDDEASSVPKSIGSAAEDKACLAANASLPPEQRPFGEFHFYQLLTHALLHANFGHILGNLVFLYVFGKAINVRLGDVGTYLVYPLLAIMSGGIAFLCMNFGQYPVASLGASGAIMGMAGVYMILFPIYPTHNVVWLRILFFLPCSMHFFVCRGFWIILFYVSQDVISILIAKHDGVGHWAHFGGFLAGMAVGSALVISRAVNAQGADLYSVILGKYAWPVVGKPSQWQMGINEGWLQRMKPMEILKKQVIKDRERMRRAKEEAMRQAASVETA